MSAVGIVGGYISTVYLQGASPGQYITSISVITGLPDFFVSEIKAGGCSASLPDWWPAIWAST